MADTDENGSCKGKTPISYLQEICMKKCVTPQYDLVANEGAVHEPLFVFKVIAGDVIGTGKGPSKKKAKHNAAISALNQLLDCPNVAQLTSMLSTSSNDTSTGSPLLVDSIDCSSGNPVGELQEMTQKKMWPPPVYEYTSEQGPPHDRDFVCTARLFLHVEQAVGKSKKLAKRNAAIAMLQRIKQGHIVPNESSLSITGTSSDDLGHVPNTEQESPEKNKDTIDEENAEKNVTQRPENVEKKKTSSMFLKSKNAKAGKVLESLQALDLGAKDSAQNVASVDKQTQMLLDLAKEQRFDVVFHDAPSLSTKGLNQCLVELTTVPPSVMCGTGTSNELARKDAVKNALRILKILTK